MKNPVKVVGHSLEDALGRDAAILHTSRLRRPVGDALLLCDDLLGQGQAPVADADASGAMPEIPGL